MTRHPVLRPGDMLRLGGVTHTVAGCDSATVRLADVTGAVTEVPTAGLLADPSLELVTASEAHRQAELNLALADFSVVKARILAVLALATCPW